jgi:hypothetical protein
MSTRDINQKIVFGLSPSPEHLGPGTVLLIGIPAAAWEYMKDGKTHHFDLSTAGVPIQIMLYGAADHDAAKAAIDKHNASLGVPTLDERRRDFSIKPKPGR